MKVPQADVVRPAHCLSELCLCNPPVQGRILVRPEHGRVLAHNVDVSIGPQLGGNPPDKHVGARQIFRQNQVANYHPALGNAVDRAERSDLPVHLLKGGGRVKHVIGGPLRKAGGYCRILILKVGQINIDNAIKQFNYLDRLVAAGVKEQGQVQPPGNGDPQRLNKMGNQMRGRNQIDVVTANALEFQHYVGKLGVACIPPVAAMGYLPIYAENTEQVTVREENSPRPAPAAKRNFLAVVGAERGDPKGIAGRADALHTRRAVNAALTGAKAAGGEQVPQRLFPAGKFAAAFKIDVPQSLPRSVIAPAVSAITGALRKHITHKSQAPQRRSPGGHYAAFNKLPS